jgi:hypothetical protein
LHPEWNVEWWDNDSGFSVTSFIMEKGRERLEGPRVCTVPSIPTSFELFFTLFMAVVGCFPVTIVVPTATTGISRDIKNKLQNVERNEELGQWASWHFFPSLVYSNVGSCGVQYIEGVITMLGVSAVSPELLQLLLCHYAHPSSS